MALARAALTIVLREQRGCLQSFETDEIMRSMAADRMCRRLYAEIEHIWILRGLQDRDTVFTQFVNPAYARTFVRLLVLAPDYVTPDYRVVVGNRYLEVVEQFRRSIHRRKRACIWERIKRADGLCEAFTSDIEDRYPDGDWPSLTAIQKRDQITTPSGEADLRPLRLTLVAKLQRLVPELCEYPVFDTLADDSGRALRRIMNQLDDHGIGISSYEKLSGEQHRARRDKDVAIWRRSPYPRRYRRYRRRGRGGGRNGRRTNGLSHSWPVGGGGEHVH